MNAAILSYPVVTSGEYAHRDSFVALLGDHPTKEQLEYASNEKQVSENTPPIFLWQTVTDEIVPVENSILMAQALKKYKVPFELHLFERGKHGLSLANEEWTYHGMEYGTYTLEQIFRTGTEVERGTVSVEKSKEEEIISYQTIQENKREVCSPEQPNERVKQWPDMADCWLKNLT